MHKQDPLSANFMISQILQHAEKGLAHIRGVHRNSILPHHPPDARLLLGRRLSIASETVPVLKNKILLAKLRELLSGILLFPHPVVIQNALLHHIPSARTWPCDADPDNPVSAKLSLLLSLQFSSADKSCLRRACSRRMKHAGKSHSKRLFLRGNFPICIHIALCSRISVAAALDKIRLFPLSPVFGNSRFDGVMHLFHRNGFH